MFPHSNYCYVDCLTEDTKDYPMGMELIKKNKTIDDLFWIIKLIADISNILKYMHNLHLSYLFLIPSYIIIY